VAGIFLFLTVVEYVFFVLWMKSTFATMIVESKEQALELKRAGQTLEARFQRALTKVDGVIERVTSLTEGGDSWVGMLKPIIPDIIKSWLGQMSGRLGTATNSVAQPQVTKEQLLDAKEQIEAMLEEFEE